MQIFAAAVELPPERRGEYLADRCGADASLRADVESLLDSDGQAGGTLDTPILGAAFDVARLGELRA